MLSEKIVRLQSRLYSIALSFSRNALEADDIFGDMVLSILTNCKSDYSDAMILQRAKWEAMNHLSKSRIYLKYVSTENDDFICEDESGFEYEFVDNSSNPEDLLIQKEEQDEWETRFSQLRETHRLIVRLLRSGYKPVEIARSLDVSRAAVSQHIAKIRTCLTA